MVDGDGETALERKNVSVIRGMIMDLDLGARFGVSGVQFFPRNAHPDFPAPDHPFQDDFLRGYELFFNDGTEDTKIDGRPLLTSFKLEAQNDEAVVDLRIPPQYVRFVRLQSRTTLSFEVAELRVFGTGFTPTAEYLSNIFDLGPDLSLWGNIRWVEDGVGREGFSVVQVRTRTGRDDSPLVFTRRFFVGVDEVEVPWQRDAAIAIEGDEINLDEIDVETAKGLYDALPLERKNEIALTLEDFRDLSASAKGDVQDDLEAWSPWSSPYDLGEESVAAENIDDDRLGAPITSPGPRRYIQFRVNFTSDALEAGTVTFRGRHIDILPDNPRQSYDMKKLIAYSSIAHMGFATLGFFIAFDLLEAGRFEAAALGIQGGMVQMVSHGFISGALFLCVGVMYDRLHSRQIGDYGGVVNTMPEATLEAFADHGSITAPDALAAIGNSSSPADTAKASHGNFTKQNLLVIQGRKRDDQPEGEMLHIGIANRGFERRFDLADYVRVENADLRDGMLYIDLVREVPDAMKPKKIAIGGQKTLEVVKNEDDSEAA